MFKGEQQKQPSGPIRYSLAIFHFYFQNHVSIFFFNNAFWINYRGYFCVPLEIPNHQGPQTTPGLAPEQWTLATFLWTTRSLRDQRVKSTSIVSNSMTILMEFQTRSWTWWSGVLERSGFFEGFFLEHNQELGSPKNRSRVEDHQKKSYPFLFFPLNGFHIGNPSPNPPNLFLFFLNFETSNKKKVDLKDRPPKKSLRNFLLKIHLCWKKHLPPGRSQQVGR